MKFDNYGNGILIRFAEEELPLLRKARAGLLESNYNVVFGIDSLSIKGVDSLSEAKTIVDNAVLIETSTNNPKKLSHKIGVDYMQGLDNSKVAETLNLTEDKIISLHTETIWEVALIGFAPGFPYLVPIDNSELWNKISRLNTPRTKVPKGSVALAAGLSAIYPNEMPGGWNIIGTTDFILFDSKLDTPATLTPGDTIQFIDLRRND